jgi:hypothetical protein
MDKLHIKNEMQQLNSKNRDFYDQLTEEERKKFSTYLMLRWGSSIEAYNTNDRAVQAWYVLACNEYLNKHFFTIGRHPKLQWLCSTAISPNANKSRNHVWIGNKKRSGESGAKTAKFLRELYPHLKEDEIDVLRTVNTKSDLKQLARDHGWDDKRIKEYF